MHSQDNPTGVQVLASLMETHSSHHSKQSTFSEHDVSDALEMFLKSLTHPIVKKTTKMPRIIPTITSSIVAFFRRLK